MLSLKTRHLTNISNWKELKFYVNLNTNRHCFLPCTEIYFVPLLLILTFILFCYKLIFFSYVYIKSFFILPQTPIMHPRGMMILFLSLKITLFKVSTYPKQSFLNLLTTISTTKTLKLSKPPTYFYLNNVCYRGPTKMIKVGIRRSSYYSLLYWNAKKKKKLMHFQTVKLKVHGLRV